MATRLNAGEYVSNAIPATAHRPSALHISLWVLQVLLAAFFLVAGGMHAFMPITEIARFAPWVADAPVALPRIIGIAEIAGALGLILPAALRIKPWLTPLAAAGVALVMALAIPVHLVRGELADIVENIAVGVLAALVAWGRARPARITPRD